MSGNDRHASDQRRSVWPPEPGLFAIRLVARGWPVPAEIRHAEAGWQAIVDGHTHPSHPRPEAAEMVARIWHYGVRIGASEHLWRLQVAAFVREHDPTHPAANPTKPINPGFLKPL